MKHLTLLFLFIAGAQSYAHESEGHFYFFVKESSAAGNMAYLSKVIRCNDNQKPNSSGYDREDLYGPFNSYDSANEALEIELNRALKRKFKTKILNFEYQCQSLK